MAELDSLIEISVNIMKRKRNPQTLKAIATEVFERKGMDINDTRALAQFEVDFMLSGYFVHCGFDKKQNQLWDLKERQKSDLLDRDADIEKDIFENDEDVVKGELVDDVYDSVQNNDDFNADDESDDDLEQPDAIEDALAKKQEEEDVKVVDTDSDEDETSEEDDEDEIERELRKRNSL